MTWTKSDGAKTLTHYGKGNAIEQSRFLSRPQSGHAPCFNEVRQMTRSRKRGILSVPATSENNRE